MNRNIFTAAFLLGAAVVLWVGVGFIGSNPLALAMTVIIAAVYALGALELVEFRRATSTLTMALAAIPDPLPSLADWLDRLHPSLQNPVRGRIEGERIGLPGPALTPYLVGLLVMLGMLGTFLGMVVTLNGAVFALEGTTDLQAIRAALASPIRGLGVAFGTSVAGVAASAMLGLISALSRRERMLTAQRLDSQIATVLRAFSLTHQRQETFQALQLQSQALPLVVDKLQAMMDQLERREQQSAERLLGDQQRFHSEVGAVYTALARSVENSLKDSARAASEALKPAVEAALTGISHEAQLLQQSLVDSTQRQLDGLSARFAETADAMAQRWAAALATHESSSDSLLSNIGSALAQFNESFAQGASSQRASLSELLKGTLANQAAADHQRLDAWRLSLEALADALAVQWQQAGEQALSQQQKICATLDDTARAMAENAQASASQTLADSARLMRCAEELLGSRLAAEAEWTAEHGERMDQLAALWRSELAALRDQEARRGDAAVDRLGELQASLGDHLATLGAALEAPLARLIETAAEAPRAAAEVIAKLRQEMTDNTVRDNQLLDERSRIMASLNSLLAAIDLASAEQRGAIDALVTSSAQQLDQAGRQFAAQIGNESARLGEIAAQVTGSAVEVSSLSEAFGFAVELFAAANEKLIASLQKIEASIDQSTARSDDQLAYYVAQAREIIDLSLLSQKGVVDELRQLSAAPLAGQVS